MDLLKGICKSSIFARIAHTDDSDVFAVGRRAGPRIYLLQRYIFYAFFQLNQHDIVLVRFRVVVRVWKLTRDANETTVRAVNAQAAKNGAIEKGPGAMSCCEHNVIVNQGGTAEFSTCGKAKSGVDSLHGLGTSHNARCGLQTCRVFLRGHHASFLQPLDVYISEESLLPPLTGAVVVAEKSLLLLTEVDLTVFVPYSCASKGNDDQDQSNSPAPSYTERVVQYPHA